MIRLTDTQIDVLRIVAAGRPIGDYVPRYRPGSKRGRGAFPVTIATRAASQLAQMGLIRRAGGEYELTRAGMDELVRLVGVTAGQTVNASSSTGPYQDWYEKDEDELRDYASGGMGGFTDTTDNLNLSPEMLRWEFQELPITELLRIWPEERWRRWYESERAARRNEDGDDSYFEGLEQEWGMEPSPIGPIVAVRIGKELDIGDGWHRSAIAVVNKWKTVPAVVGTMSSHKSRMVGASSPATKKPTFKELLPEIASELQSLASENAHETEGVPRNSDGIEYYRAYQSSAQSIRDSMNSPHEFSNYYTLQKLGRPLTDAEANQVMKQLWGFTKDGKPAPP